MALLTHLLPRQSIGLVDDYIVAMLGGRKGIVTVAGQQYCLRGDGCLGPLVLQAAPPSHAAACNGNGLCVKGQSWKINFFFYHSIGSETDQSTGGYHESHHFCWKWGFVPWSCLKKTGSNDLTVASRFKWTGQGAAGAYTKNDGAHNAESVKAKEWSFFVSAKVNNNGDFSPGRPGDAGSLDLAGVCGYEGTSVGASSANTFTAYGDVAGVCDGTQNLY